MTGQGSLRITNVSPFETSCLDQSQAPASERNQVHFWLGYDVALHALLCLAVGARKPFVLTDMLRPRRNDEGFDVTTFILHFAEDTPVVRKNS